MINVKCAPKVGSLGRNFPLFISPLLLENPAQTLSWLQRRMRRGQNLCLPLQQHEAPGTQAKRWKNNGSCSRSTSVMGEPQRGLQTALLPDRKSATALQMLKQMKNPLEKHWMMCDGQLRPSVLQFFGHIHLHDFIWPLGCIYSSGSTQSSHKEGSVDLDSPRSTSLPGLIVFLMCFIFCFPCLMELLE